MPRIPAEHEAFIKRFGAVVELSGDCLIVPYRATRIWDDFNTKRGLKVFFKNHAEKTNATTLEEWDFEPHMDSEKKSSIFVLVPKTEKAKALKENWISVLKNKR
jgi:hypothetical protein